jgi:hypothetical protein
VRADTWRAEAARHLEAANELFQQREALPAAERAAGDAAEQERARRDRIDRRAADRAQRARRGLRRFRPGVGRSLFSPAMIGTAGTASRHAALSDEALDREMEELGRVLAEHGELEANRLAQLLDARRWGPGRFRAALRQAVQEGRARRRRGRYGLPR